MGLDKTRAWTLLCNMFRMSRWIFVFLVVAVSCKAPKPVLVAGENIPVQKTTTADSTAWYFLKPWRDSVQTSMQEVIGLSDTAYFPGLPGGNLNNLVADMVMQYAQKFMTDSLGFPPHMCLLNRGGLRNTLPKGNITARDIFEMMPFENELVFLKISGRCMDSVLNRIAAIGGAAVSGLDLEIGNKQYFLAEIAGMRYDSRREYWIATSDYVAKGGDGFGMLPGAILRINTGKKLRDIVSDGIRSETKSHKKLLYHNDNRIRSVGAK
jgi:2',3'-cyclic-nucleotide 2'-phosphodiesterase (5'-nucleotidase family)